MAIHVQEQSNLQKGHLKSIDESGIMMIFDTLQKYQYAFPIKSTVRELLCNGIDSVAEKKVAKEILQGKAKVEDYFVEMEGDLYKDSKFQADYYDLKWLSDNDKVTMTYYVKGALEKDVVVFSDNGVGLGGKRLEGYFKLAYSTKRLSKLPLGKFGLGAKSPLSVGVDFYTVESRYNGRLFRFNIYSSKVDSIIPKINMETGKDNDFVIFNEGRKGTNEDGSEWSDEYPVYYLPTTAKNGVTVTVEAKKHHKTQYLDAVKSQMLYFEGLELQIITPAGTEIVPYKADIIYEDDLIVMSNNQYYSKPHLLLNKVNYGYVAWDELELEDKDGNIGIKVAPEDVEVNPSRESVLWTEKTKNKVLARFNEVVDIAASMIQKELQATDFMQWVKTCYQVYNKYSERGGVVGRLSKIVDLSRAKFKFLPDERITFDAKEPLPGIISRVVSIFQERDASKVTKKKIIRDDFWSWGNKFEMKFYIMKKGERASNRKDKYLVKLHGGEFIQIIEPFLTLKEAEDAGADEYTIKQLYKHKDRQAYWDALLASGEVKWYANVEVPEDFNANEDEVEEVEPEKQTEEEIKAIKVAQMTAAERRKQEGKTLIYTPKKLDHNPNVVLETDTVTGSITYGSKAFEFQKLEIPIAEINNWDAKEIYYGFDRDNELMQFVSMIARSPGSHNGPGSIKRGYAHDVKSWVDKKWWRKNGKSVQDVYKLKDWQAYPLQNFFDTKLMLVKASKTNARYFRDFSRIEEFFISIENKTITMSNLLIQWNTARIIRDRIASAAFLHNFPFRGDMSDLYDEVCTYIIRNYREVEEYTRDNKMWGLSANTYKDMLAHLDRVQKFQHFVSQAPNDFEGIGALAGQLFGNKDLRDGMAIDPVMMRKVDELCDFANTCGIMMNYIPVLTGYSAGVQIHSYTPGETRTPRGTKVPEELEHELRMYLDSRGALDYGITTAKLPVEGEVFAEIT